MSFFLLKWYLNEIVIKLCLELFCFSNLIHFQLEWRKSYRYGTSCEQYRKNICSTQLSEAEMENFNLAHAWLEKCIQQF